MQLQNFYDPVSLTILSFSYLIAILVGEYHG